MLTTLGALITDTLDRADMEAGGPVSRVQVVQRINAAIGVIFDAVRKVRGDTYFDTDATITTSNGTDEYALPDDFLTVSATGVWWVTGQGQNLPIRQYNPNESQIALVNTGWYYVAYARALPVRYRLRGANIRFTPVPNGVYRVLLNYIPRVTVLVDDADEWDGYGGFEEAVKWHAAASCKAKQEADTAFELEMFKMEYQRVLDTTERDENEPQQVAAVNQGPLYDDW